MRLYYLRMRDPFKASVFSIAAAALLAAACRVGPAPTPLKPDARALWVKASTLSSEQSIDLMVERAARAGFNNLLVQVRARGDALYRSDLAPGSALLPHAIDDFDPLAHTLAAAHERGLDVHAWLATHLVTGLDGAPPQPDHIVYAHPEWLAVPRQLAVAVHQGDPDVYREIVAAHAQSNAESVEGLYLSPGNPDAAQHLRGMLIELAQRYPVDGIHLDYVRFPNLDYSFDPTTLRRFRARLALDAERRRRLDSLPPTVWADSFPERWSAFRVQQITSFVAESYRAIKRARPEIEVSAAVFADLQSARTERGQDWGEWAKRGVIDLLCPMTYTAETYVFRDLLARALANTRPDVAVWAGIGAWQIPVDTSVDMIHTARQLGAAGVALFSYERPSSQGESNPAGTDLKRVGERAFGERR